MFLVMVKKLAESYPERQKYVNDLSLPEICCKDSPSNAYGIIKDIKNHAASSNMVVNMDKSVVLSISFLRTKPTYYPLLHQQQMVALIKLLGVHISSDMKWDKEVGSRVKRGNMGISAMKLLSRYGVPVEHLLRFYLSFIRPILEYCCQVWHFSLTHDQLETLEQVQYHVLLVAPKSHKVPYILLLQEFKLVTLEKRRQQLGLKLGKGILKNPNLCDILPQDFSPCRQKLQSSAAEPIPKIQPVFTTLARYEKKFCAWVYLLL